jgi:putative ABC transport system permease protein
VTKYMADRRTVNFNPVFALQPLTTIHLHSHLQGEASENGNIQLVYILSGLSLLIMFIAWANYINLSTARALSRSLEVGIRKTIGSTKGELIKQFLVESLMVNLCAVLLAIGFILIKSTVHFELDLLNQSPSTMLMVGFFIFVVVGAIISGLYPALILSSFKPSTVLKGNGKGTAINTLPNLRKLMVVTQFTISIALVIGSVAIFKQINFMEDKELGINIDQILVVKTSASFGPPGSDSLFVQKLELLGNKLSSYPDIKGTAASYDIPGKVYKSVVPSFRNFNKSNESLHLYYSRIDHHFINLFETNLIAGRNFSDMTSYNVVINMEALKTFGFATPEEAIGERISYGSNSDAEGLEIIGVVDFRATSYKEHNYPIVFQTYWGPMQYLSIKIAPEKYSNIEENISLIGETWGLIFPDIPFDYFFLNDSFNSQYRSDLQFSSALNLLTALAIFIACLGLYGLSIFVVETRTKEIGIRKVMGASIQQLVRLLAKNVVLLILIASVIALPLTWYLIDLWLENYPFRVQISLWVFTIPILGVLFIALLTVSKGVLKTAFTNPVDSLRQS